MKFKVFIALLVFFIHMPVSVMSLTDANTDTLDVKHIDSLIEQLFQLKDSLAIDTVPSENFEVETERQDSYSRPRIEKERQYTPIDIHKVLAELDARKPTMKRLHINDRFLKTNPFFLDVIFHGYSSNNFEITPWSVDSYFENQKKAMLIPTFFVPFNMLTIEKEIQELRDVTLRKIAAYEPQMIAYQVDELPDVTDFVRFKFNIVPIDENVLLQDRKVTYSHRKIVFDKVKLSPWTTNSNALLQFSQNYISDNWYQGGSDNISILGIINGKFNYDAKKNIQWDNFAEWRVGFNSVEGDTMRVLNTNDDILRATSKLGIKAGGNWFYSGSVDFSTHFFNNYRAINSPLMKAKFLTPVRFNVGVGLDYKYKKIFSLMLSPLSYKYIYVNDTINVNKKSFGILPGENVLSQIGSSFRAQLSYSPVREIQIDSKLSFYTNYEKVEIDWEIVTNFRVNRFLSTRLSLNPRYDNTIILAAGEKAKLQFKELLTFGLSYRLL
ncbi:MAG: DUF3078 domain-containing protein [Paludibacter sp.]|nr:DUF3078 domain-containing protein [Paludibacter sp.]